jgi:hypothetical protein
MSVLEKCKSADQLPIICLELSTDDLSGGATQNRYKLGFSLPGHSLAKC